VSLVPLAVAFFFTRMDLESGDEVWNEAELVWVQAGSVDVVRGSLAVRRRRDKQLAHIERDILLSARSRWDVH
jgi:hypothetical protein